MTDLKYIKGFYFDFAQYHLLDKSGKKVKLKINYKDNKFEIEHGSKLNSSFQKEVEKLANSLLDRKSKVNRAQAIKI